MVPLVALAVGWLIGLDRWWLPASIALTFLPLALLPAWLIAAAALLGRHRRLAVTAGLVAIVHLVAVAPALPLASPRVGADGPSFRLVTANSFFRNPTPDAWAAGALALDADVLLIQEYTPTIADSLWRAGIDKRYPWHRVSLRPYSAGVATFSRFPIRETSRTTFGGDGIAVSVQVGDVWVRVLNVHTAALPDRPAWRASFTQLANYLPSQPSPLVAAGDFNATLWHRPLHDLLKGPLRDAHSDRGRGLASTWPVGKPGSTFALLDHVLIDPTIDVAHIGERSLPGSDHRAVVADLRLPDPSQAIEACAASKARRCQ